MYSNECFELGLDSMEACGTIDSKLFVVCGEQFGVVVVAWLVW